MQPSDIFILPDGRLRAGWRLLLFLFFFLIAIKLLQGLAGAFLRDPAQVSLSRLIVLSSAAGFAAVCLTTWLMTHLLEHQPFGSVGLQSGSSSRTEIGTGFLLGAGSIALVTFVEWLIGAIRFQPTGAAAESTLELVSLTTVILALSAPSEELLFRGYAFQRIEEGTTGYVALAISSVVFGWLHGNNPHATKLAVTNTMLAGVLLSVAYLKTRALWLSIGFHFAWNWSLTLVGLPVSGLDLGRMPWQAVPAASPLWIHGGDYGPEGGVIATVVLIGGSVFLFFLPQKNFKAAEKSLSAIN